jgi:hypothetical protein
MPRESLFLRSEGSVEKREKRPIKKEDDSDEVDSDEDEKPRTKEAEDLNAPGRAVYCRKQPRPAPVWNSSNFGNHRSVVG